MMYFMVGLLCLASSVLSQDAPIYRLPRSVMPRQYVIRLEPDIDNNTLSGAMMIDIETTNDTSEDMTSITLHAGIDVSVVETTARLLDMSGLILQMGAFVYDDSNTVLKLVLPAGEMLKNNHSYLLSLEFKSLLSSEPKGLFTGWYNSTSKYVASNFRPTHARDAFPCFDEPHFKVPLQLQVVRPSRYSVVSTARLLSSTPSDLDDKVVDTFQFTQPISIHSLGLFISEVQPIESMGFKLYVPADTPTTVPYLSELLKEITTSLGEFPFAPLNLVVLPDQLYTSFASYGFVFTSPEVYAGLVGSRSRWLALKLRLTEALLRQFLEFSHTPAWWSDLWLSESVGAFLAVTLQPEPSYKNWLRVNVRSDALGPYFHNTTVPVVDNQLMSREDIESVIANRTIRDKGLSVLNMWNDTMPEGAVLQTIYDFIKSSNSVVTTADFVALMVKNIASNTTYDVKPTIGLLPAWLNSTVYPVVSLWTMNTNQFTLSQSGGCPGTWNTSIAPVWPISVSFSQNSSADWGHYRWGVWLLNSTANFTANFTPSHWAIFNLESAPYRVNYGPGWADIVAALKGDLRNISSAPSSVRAALQDDAVAFSLSGCLPWTTSLSVISATHRDQFDWLPVAKALDALIAKIGGDSTAYTQLGMYVATLFTPEILSSMDLINTKPSPGYGRVLMTPWLCRYNLGNCQQAVVQLNQQLLLGNMSMIDPSDIENVACYGARYNSSVVADLLAGYSNPNSSLWLKHIYSIGLGCLTDPVIVHKLLHILINDPSPVTVNDARQIMARLTSTIENSAGVIHVIIDHATAIQAKFGSNSLSDTIKILGNFRIDVSKLQALMNESLGLDPSVVQSVLEVQVRVNQSMAWWAQYSPNLLAALPQAPTTTPTPTTSGGPTNPPTASIPTATPTSAATSVTELRVVCLVTAVIIVVFSCTL